MDAGEAIGARPGRGVMGGPGAAVAAPASRAASPTRLTLRYSLIDGTAYTVMIGLAETFFPLFALELGLGEVTAGLILTVPFVLAASMQMVVPLIVERLRSYRRWVVFAAALQAAALLPLAAIALIGEAPAWAVFLLATAYWFGAVGGGPAWTSWMGLVTPARVRARYFALRTRWLQVGQISGLAIGALTLEGAAWIDPEGGGPPLWSFAVLFLLAAAARGVSAWYLKMQTEPNPLPLVERRVPAREAAGLLVRTHGGRLVLCLVLMQVVSQAALPFWHPFVREQAGVSHLPYIGLLAALLLGKALAQPIAGAIAHRYGAAALLKVGALAVAPVTPLWLLSPDVWWLLVMQVIGGATLGLFELGAFLVLIGAFGPAERTAMVTRYTFANSLGMVVGSLMGGRVLGEAPVWGAYAAVFIAAGVGRLAVASLIWAASRQPRSVPGAGPEDGRDGS